MVRGKDPLWEHVEIKGNRFMCKFCKSEFAGGISRIKSHLSGIKGRDIDTCAQVPPDVQAKALLAIGGHESSSASKRSRSETVGSQVGETGGIFTHTSSFGVHQSTMPEMVQKMDKSDVDKKVADFFILNNIAFNVVQSKSFLELLKSVAEYGPSYKPPSFSTLRTKLIPERKKEMDEYVEKVKKTWDKSGCTIMSDTWSDIKQRCFINFIASSPGGSIFLKSYEISQDRKTGSFLKDICSKVIDSVGPKNVVQFITVNASNFESVGDQLVGKYPTMYKTRCGAHGIQLLLKDIYMEVQWVKSVIYDAKSIQTYMYRHTIVTSMMKDATKEKELKRPCATRFASNFQMLQSIANVENELRMFVESPQWRALDYSKQTLAKKVETIIHNLEFWSEVKAVIKVCEPIVRVLRLVDGDGSTFPYLYEAMERARETIKTCAHEGGESRHTHILYLFEKRRRDNIIHPLHAVAAFLNPAYMTSSSFKETRDMKEGINYMIENMIQSDEKFDFTSQIQVYRCRSSSLFTCMALTMIKTSHPRVWWDFCGDDLPILQKYAIRLLSQSCSSSSCERNWSAFEAAQTKKRNRLSPKMLNNLIFVRMNRMMIEKMSFKETQDLKPIDLDNLGDLPDYAKEEQEREAEEDESDDLSSTIIDDFESLDEDNDLWT